MGLVDVDLNNITLDDDDFDDDNPETLIYVRFRAWCNGFKQLKVCKKETSTELISVA